MGDRVEWQNRVDAFWQRLKDTVARDNGIRAILKRNAGVRMYDADGRAIAAFYRIYGGGLVSEMNEDRCFFATCATCLWEAEDWEKSVPLVEGARRFMREGDRNTFSKRMRTILDLPWDEDGYLAGKLCRLLKFCQSKGIVVDGKELFQDLLWWDMDDRRIQRKWAREFYRTDNMADDGGKENVD